MTIQETKAPTGYKINPELFIRQIKVDEATGSITTFNEIEVPEPRDTVYGNLTIYKTADDSKRGANTAKDVWFNVKSDDGVTDENIVTKSQGVDGAATLSDLPVYKASGEYVKYIITELGYKNADGTYSIPDIADYINSKSNETVIKNYSESTQTMSDYEIDNELAKAQNFNELLAKSALNDEEKDEYNAAMSEYENILNYDDIMCTIEIPKDKRLPTGVSRQHRQRRKTQKRLRTFGQKHFLAHWRCKHARCYIRSLRLS